MDTSETYIKQCEKAEEIQETWEPKVGDCFFHKWEDGSLHIEREPIHLSSCFGWDGEPQISPWILSWGRNIWGGDYFWLPRQDQLQEMIGKFPEVFERFAQGVGRNSFNYSAEEMGNYELHCTTFTSMEQLWLAFCMSQKYNKVWSTEKEEWVSA